MMLRSRTRSNTLVALTSLFALSTMGCNLFGRLDNPGTLQDKYDIAVALANAGDCDGAANLLLTIQPVTDDVLSALGWAQLCQGGATAANISTTLYKFSGSSTDYTPIGALARILLPMSGTRRSHITDAITTFGQIYDPPHRNLQRGIAELVLAAAQLALEAPNDGASTLAKSDIAPAACAADANNCAASANCTNANTMSDNDATAFLGNITSAATDLSTSGASDLNALATAIKLGLGAAGNSIRCFVFNQVVPN